MKTLKSLDGKCIKIISPGNDHDVTDCDVIDSDGTYAKWLSSMEAAYFILRPDFYVAATANSAKDISYRFSQVIDKLHLS